MTSMMRLLLMLQLVDSSCPESLGITKTPLAHYRADEGVPTGTAHKAFTGSTGNHQTIKQSDDPGEGDDESGGGSTPKRISWEQIL